MPARSPNNRTMKKNNSLCKGKKTSEPNARLGRIRSMIPTTNSSFNPAKKKLNSTVF